MKEELTDCMASISLVGENEMRMINLIENALPSGVKWGHLARSVSKISSLLPVDDGAEFLRQTSKGHYRVFMPFLLPSSPFLEFSISSCLQFLNRSRSRSPLQTLVLVAVAVAIPGRQLCNYSVIDQIGKFSKTNLEYVEYV